MKKTACFLSPILILLLSACGAAMSASPGSTAELSEGGWNAVVGDVEMDRMAPQAAAPAEDFASEKSVPDSSELQVVNPSDRIVLYDASLSLVVNDPSEAASEITDMAFAKGGWVVNSNITQSVYGPEGKKYYAGDISIRVPTTSSDQLKATLAEIEALAVEVESRTMTGRDVTAEYIDTQSRLENLERSAARLQEIMDEAVDTEAVLQVEMQLRQVTSEIEVLTGQIQFYDTASQYSLITIHLRPYIPSQPIQIAGWHPEGVAKEAFEDLIHSLQNLVDFLIRLGICGVPALLIIILFMTPFFLIGRFFYRRYKKTHP
ncbi:MAG: DUF4349 domain-containing protein [Anaerolineales bacterium]